MGKKEYSSKIDSDSYDKKSKNSSRRYDLADLMLVGFYNLVVFSLGLLLGWILWHKV